MFAVCVFIFGLLIGSFLNVCIYRIPRDKSIIFPPSQCTFCGSELHALDLVPLVSFFVLGGKCRYCKTALSWQYPAVELLTAVLFLLSYYAQGLSVEFFIFVIFISLLIVITWIDYYWMLIPNFLLLFGTLTAAVYHFALGDGHKFLLGAAVGGGTLFLIYLLSRGGIGEGDIYFAGMLGGFLGFPLIIEGLFVAFITGGLTGMLLILSKRKKRNDPVPFGPFLALGAVFAMFFGQDLWNLYFALLG